MLVISQGSGKIEFGACRQRVCGWEVSSIFFSSLSLLVVNVHSSRYTLSGYFKVCLINILPVMNELKASQETGVFGICAASQSVCKSVIRRRKQTELREAAAANATLPREECLERSSLWHQ